MDEPWPQACHKPQRQVRSDIPSPMVISDQLHDLQGQHDGKIYSSKRALRASYRAAGVVEVGNDPARLKPFEKPAPKGVRESLRKARARFERGERTKTTKRLKPFA